MKISIKKLQKIIKEEIENVLKETEYRHDEIMVSREEDSGIEVSEKDVKTKLEKHGHNFDVAVQDPDFPKPVGENDEGEIVYDAKHILTWLGH